MDYPGLYLGGGAAPGAPVTVLLGVQASGATLCAAIASSALTMPE